MILVLPLATLALFTAAASWTLFAVAGVHLKQALHLNETAFGALLALPMLAGGMAALGLGALTNRLGARRVLIACIAALLVALAGFLMAETLAEFFLVGAGIGLAGGLFSAGLHYVSSQCTPARAGLSMGIYGAGMLGAGFTYLIVPLMHSAYEWQMAPIAYIAISLLALMLLLTLTDPEAAPLSRPQPSPTKQLATLLRTRPGIGYFCFHYAYLFGSFVALALWLPDYISAQYGLSLKQASMLSLLFTLPGALAQIPGGAFADRWGPVRVQRWVMGLSVLALLVLSYPDTIMDIRGINGPVSLSLSLPLPLFLGLLCVLGTALGLGKGAQMRLLFDTFPGRTGAVGGAMLFAGCLTASILPLLFGLSNDILGVRSTAFMMVFGLAALCTWTLERSIRSEQRRRLLGPRLGV